MNLKDTKNILVIRFSSLGDLITLEPTFRAFRYFYPQDHITFLTTPVGFELFRDSNYFDDYLIYDGLLKAIIQMKNRKFDIVFNVQNNKPSLILASLLHSKLTINKSYSLQDKLLCRKPKVKNFLDMLESSGILRDVLTTYDTDVHKTVVLPNKKIPDFTQQNFVAVSVGSSKQWPSKQWPLEKYIELIQFFAQNNVKTILVGSQLEVKASIEIKKYFNENEIVDFVNKTTVGELKNILASVKFFVGNDSGPAHIAAGVGTPTITLFGSTDIKHCVKYLSYSGHHICIKPDAHIKCHPCYKKICPTKHECMYSIETTKVISTIKENFGSMFSE